MYERSLPDAYAMDWEAKARYLFWLLIVLLAVGSTAFLTWLIGGSMLIPVLAALMVTSLVGFFAHQYWVLFDDNRYTQQNQLDTQFLSWFKRAFLVMSLAMGLTCLFAPGGPNLGMLIGAVKHWFPAIAHAHLAFHIFAFAGLFLAATIVAAASAMLLFRLIRWLAPRETEQAQDLKAPEYAQGRLPFIRGFAWGCLLMITLASVFAVLGPGGVVPALAMAISTFAPQLPVFAGVLIGVACLPFAMGVLNKIWQKDTVIDLSDGDLGGGPALFAGRERKRHAAQYLSANPEANIFGSTDEKPGDERMLDPGDTTGDAAASPPSTGGAH